MVGAIDEGDFDIGASQMLRSGQAPKTTPDDDNPVTHAPRLRNPESLDDGSGW